ncbi:MAG: cysteine synthase A [Filifactoraceae bacterium]
MVFNNVTEAIGNTPIVKINSLSDEDMAEIYVKLEFCNPGSSVKDRAAVNMIAEMEEQGIISKGAKLVEATSGNTGIGLAMVGAALGYKVAIVMPDTMSLERRKLVEAYGAELILTPGENGMKGAIEEAEKMVSEQGFIMVSQFENKGNPNAHMLVTAREIIWDCSTLDAFVAGVGTGGTITGAGKVLKEAFKGIEIVAVEPKDSPVISGGKAGPHKIQGIGAGFIPKNLDISVIDKIEQVEIEEALEYARYSGINEGILLGISGGAAFAAAVKTAKRLGKGKKVLFIAPDNGERYLSTQLY